MCELGGSIFIPHTNKRECKNFEAIVYIIYKREGYSFSLMYTFEKAIKNFEVKIDVQKGS